jgi:4-diphosphocytidyl-2-C-methyl-D-erythritol kinase
MTALHDIGRAKINLTLEVLGRRADRFHELKSLVAFANLGDRLALDPGGALDLEVEGPFAAALGPGNLILEAGRAARARVPDARLGRFHLVKFLPVAAGLGGGSADAAAALRLIARANPRLIEEGVLAELALKLGSDVRVCLKNLPALMTGRGEKVEPVQGFPSCGVVLANPFKALATNLVYAALDAKPLAAEPRGEGGRLDFGGSFDALLAYALPRGNDLEAPAANLVPDIRAVLAGLAALKGVRLARLSGSGPTCFALFPAEEEANRAAGELAAARPSWWIAAGALEV